MLAFLTAQVLLILFAHFIGNRNVELIWERRRYAPYDSPHDDPFHTFGWLAAAIPIALGTLLVGLLERTIPAFVLPPFALALICWVVFDATIGKGAFGNPYYLGTTSSTDKFLFQGFDVKVWFVRLRWTGFGKNAGKRKIQYALGGVVLLNLLYLFV